MTLEEFFSFMLIAYGPPNLRAPYYQGNIGIGAFRGWGISGYLVDTTEGSKKYHV